MTVAEFKHTYDQPERNTAIFLSEPVNLTEGRYKTSNMILDVNSFNYTVDGQVIASGSNNDRTIADAERFSVELDGSKHNAKILEKEKFHKKIISSSGDNNYALFLGAPYYYIKFTPIDFKLSTGELTGSLIREKEGQEGLPSNLFFKSDQLSIDFRTSDYNALDNNTDRSTTSKHTQKVDRSRKQPNPVNLSDILDDTAEKAEIQESNYTLTGLKNSKYYGSTTSETEFGESPVLGLVEFEGAVYPAANVLSSSQASDTQNNFICSQSAGDRPIDTLYFNTSREPSKEVQSAGGQELLLPRLTTTRIYFTGSKLDLGGIDSFPEDSYDSQSLSVNAFLDIKADDVLALSYFHAPGDTSTYENLLVTSVEYKSESLGGPVTQTTASFERNYLSTYDSNTTLTDWTAGDFTVSIHKYTPDVIYKIEDNKPYRISNKKLYLKDSGEIYYVDDRGRVLAKSKEC